MLQKKSTFICPYCFDEHKMPDVQFRCTNTHCIKVDDVEMTRYKRGRMDAPEKGNTCFSVSSKNKVDIPKYAVCPVPECKQKTYNYVCPSCHNNLPESTLSGKNLIISIIGTRSTGKSHFIGVLINELIERISGDFGGAMEPFGNSADRYKLIFGKHLYKNKHKLALTKSSETNKDNGAYEPLIYHLTMGRKNLFSSFIESFTFVFFDTPGEDLQVFETMSTVTKYICKSAGIIFLLDPLQIPKVSNDKLFIGNKILKRAGHINEHEAAKSDEIISRVSRLIRNDKGLGKENIIDIPFAAVFSKFDVIEPIVKELAPESTILEPSPHCKNGIFDDSDQKHVDSEIQGLLKIWEADSFKNQLKINYSNYSFFAVSSLGHDNNPAEDDTIDKPNPHRIEDPLLWIFKEKGIINSSEQTGLKWFIKNFIKNNKFLSIVVLILILITAGYITVYVKSVLNRPVVVLEKSAIKLKYAADQVISNAEIFISAADQLETSASQFVNLNRQVLRACEGYMKTSDQQTRNSLARQIVTLDKQATSSGETHKSSIVKYTSTHDTYKVAEKEFIEFDEQFHKYINSNNYSGKRASDTIARVNISKENATVAAERASASSKRAGAAHDQVILTNKQREDCLKKL